MSDFTRTSNHNPHANFKSVRIGSDCPILEVELNEMQDIAEQRTKDLIKSYFGDGLNGEQQFTYNPETRELVLVGGKALVKGNTIQITTLSVEANEGDSVYLKVWEQVVRYNDPIYYLGNVQETNLVPNTMLDDRIGGETSRRVQVQYDLVTSKVDEDNHDYLYVGEIVNGKFVVQTSLKTEEERVLVERYTTEGSQQVFTTKECFVKGTNTLQVFVNGKLQIPEIDYIEVSPNTFRLSNFTNADDVVDVIYKRAITSQQVQGHGSKHAKDGTDPLDITELADSENLIEKLRVVSTSAIIIDAGSFNEPNLDDAEEIIYDGGAF